MQALAANDRQQDSESANAWLLSAMERLLAAVQELSHARSMEAVTAVVREAARELTGADGATFVLRDGDQCHYVDENAVSPLWKGRRFPMSACISGWVMLHGEAAVIEDIYSDPRIPIEAYRPTFVKSLAMVPIRRGAPIGAIGNYWARRHLPTPDELRILQALADTTSVAIENAQLYAQLETRLRALQESNYELSRFAWVASHDLQEPLRTIVTQVELLQRRYGGQLDERAQRYIETAAGGAKRLQALIEELLVHACAEKVENFHPVKLDAVLESVKQDIQTMLKEQDVQIASVKLPVVEGDATLLGRVLQNLLSNAVKFQLPGARACVEVGCEWQGNEWRIAVKDNGIGIDPEYHQRIFGFFQRLHSKERYPGSGIGLATCKKIVELHGGRIGVESRPGEGSEFWFTLPAARAAEAAGGEGAN